jgi:membrane fusion protein (multidrug efflux system)
VLVIGPGNKAVQRTVTADRTLGEDWIVTAGLQSGDRVIVEGLGKIKPGQTVVPVPAGSPPRRAGGSHGPGGGASAGGYGSDARGGGGSR